MKIKEINGKWLAGSAETDDFYVEFFNDGSLYFVLTDETTGTVVARELSVADGTALTDAFASFAKIQAESD